MGAGPEHSFPSWRSSCCCAADEVSQVELVSRTLYVRPAAHSPGNLLATRAGDLCYLDFGMMSEAPENARYAIIAHVVHLVNRDYQVSHGVTVSSVASHHCLTENPTYQTVQCTTLARTVPSALQLWPILAALHAGHCSMSSVAWSAMVLLVKRPHMRSS